MGRSQYSAIPSDPSASSPSQSPSTPPWASPAASRKKPARILARLALFVSLAFFAFALWRHDVLTKAKEYGEGIRDSWFSGGNGKGAWEVKLGGEPAEEAHWPSTGEKVVPAEVIGAVPSKAPASLHDVNSPPSSSFTAATKTKPTPAKATKVQILGPTSTNPALPDPYMFGNFYDYLSPASEMRYITAVPLGGISNQMMGIFNLIVLANRTSRGPILPPIIPNLHQKSHLRGPSYSTFYNISLISSALNLPVLDWNVLREAAPFKKEGDQWEWAKHGWVKASQQLTCYIASSMGAPPQDGGRVLAASFGMGLWLDVIGVYGPGDSTKGKWGDMDTATKMVRLNKSTEVVVSNVKGREDVDGDGEEEWLLEDGDNGEAEGVEKDLACLTESYWLRGANKETRVVTTLLRFSDELEALADETIARTLSIPKEGVRDADFITVHLRRNDLFNKCKPPPKNWQELASQGRRERGQERRDSSDIFDIFEDDLDERSWEVELEAERAGKVVQRRKGKGGKAPWQKCHFADSHIISTVESLRHSISPANPQLVPVLLATDDTSAAALATFDAQPGWHRLSHHDTGVKSKGEFSDFWVVMRDTAVLTRGKAFVGVQVSTMSRLAAMRGSEWYGRTTTWF